MNKECKQCKKEFEDNSRYTNRKFCSYECCLKFKSALYYQRHKDKWKSLKRRLFQKVCLNCESVFEGRPEQTYCSPSCSSSHHMKGRSGILHPCWKGLVSIKQRATDCVQYALQKGELTETNCEVCGSGPPLNRVHGHHQRYNKPLSVNCVCVSCHFRVHSICKTLLVLAKKGA